MDTAIINISDGVNGYVDLVKHVLEHGRETAPRGMKTREIEDAVIRIDDVRNTLPLGVGLFQVSARLRRVNYLLAYLRLSL